MRIILILLFIAMTGCVGPIYEKDPCYTFGVRTNHCVDIRG